ncbi:hypothetical protein P175DRAFT_0492918 [Aspergillus ochraceoroseus IBT 24754]|uniref:Zn(2)-C6 fungal-type domain-containing protein n=3 Tax=Aspergillus subgen. Nidulantes TaxID=2720870 RepID=A0A0F8UBV9_9EURO|nr:uncharacterized protein P175DRAFT_0492918 [Aspergillus ochraceoroseus IBT 24754]KKK17179.1 hypothetical protein ARAM_002474 [Aspergillus rambellii]KKK20823.1 hypothetical protein AOCH_007035 [Aspergillus ochraceoroseus]PTU20572.1 hypothetical protein P175DRAFT_0492918 [Aspergillus ochraceoroseus IBT 24754]
MSTASTNSAGDTNVVQQTAPTPQLNRSCESCRSLKVRCLPDPASPNQCQRCTKAKRHCVFVAPQRRRPRKRTDSRVAQLEREMRQMRSFLKDRLQVNESSQESSESEGEDPREVESETNSRDTVSSSKDGPTSISGSTKQSDLPPRFPTPSNANTFNNSPISALNFNQIYPEGSPEFPPEEDVVDRGLISLDCAEKLFSFFFTELASFAPMVDLPSNTPASQLRRSKPVLFLSIIAAAALSVNAGLATILNRELVSVYAEQFFINGKKSLELVQALLLMIVFYFPPQSPLAIQFYQYAHIAGTMALEIGIASEPRVPRAIPRNPSKKPAFDELMAEEAKSILYCYHFASQVALKTRRPNLLLFNDWMKKCVAHLETSPRAIDRQVATWFELQQIVDEALASFGLDDTSSGTTLTESRLQAILRWFDNRMQSWSKNHSNNMIPVPVNLEYYYTKVAIYELAIGEGYRDPDAIKQSYYTLPSPDDDIQPFRMPLSAARIDITVKWMNACHELLDLFLSCNTDLLRKIPNLIYTRAGVAIMSLQKIWLSVRCGDLGEVITPQTVKMETYLDVLTERLRDASDGGMYKIPARWYFVIAVKSRNWYDRFQERLARQEAEAIAPVQSTPPAPPSSIHVQNPPEFPPSHPPQSTIPLAMGTDISSMPNYDAMNTGYGAPPVMESMWPPPHGGHQPYLEINHFQGYQQAVLAPQFAYGPHPKILPSHSQQGESMPPKPDMEVDGWTAGHNIYGMPTLPEG